MNKSNGITLIFLASNYNYVVLRTAVCLARVFYLFIQSKRFEVAERYGNFTVCNCIITGICIVQKVIFPERTF